MEGGKTLLSVTQAIRACETQSEPSTRRTLRHTHQSTTSTTFSSHTHTHHTVSRSTSSLFAKRSFVISQKQGRLFVCLRELPSVVLVILRRFRTNFGKSEAFRLDVLESWGLVENMKASVLPSAK